MKEIRGRPKLPWEQRIVNKSGCGFSVKEGINFKPSKNPNIV